MGADWSKIKTEYITSDISYRQLAEKYGVNPTTIAKKAGKEGWVEQRQQQANKTLSKTLNAVSSAQASRAAKLQKVADKLVNKVEVLLDTQDAEEIGAKAMKHLSGVLKDVMEIQMIKSDVDLREQEARISALQKKAEAEDTHTDVVITFGSEEQRKWAE